jgi:hypothetical protein
MPLPASRIRANARRAICPVALGIELKSLGLAGRIRTAPKTGGPVATSAWEAGRDLKGVMDKSPSIYIIYRELSEHPVFKIELIAQS